MLDPKLRELIELVHSMGWEIAVPASTELDDAEDMGGMIIGQGPYISWILGDDAETHVSLNPYNRLVH